MEVKWNVDPEFQKDSWGDINKTALKASGMVGDAKLVLDLGGGAGWFGRFLAKEHSDSRMISVDIAPRKVEGYADVEHVKGSALDIPICDSRASIVGAHAILHHVPDELDKCIAEVERVLSPGGILIAHEPLADNCLATLARKFVRTDVHEEGERPLSYSVMKKVIDSRLKIEKADFFFLTTYLMPHVLPRLPESLVGSCRRLASFFLKFDRKVLATMPKTRKYAGYVSIVARKQI